MDEELELLDSLEEMLEDTELDDEAALDALELAVLSDSAVESDAALDEPDDATAEDAELDAGFELAG